ncbi:MAG: potassium channel family protein [Pseudomonadota bacterium]
MFTVLLVCIALLVVTTLIHYEALSVLNARLPALKLPSRSKLLVVISVTFLAHAVEIVVYGIALYLLVTSGIGGGLKGSEAFSMADCIYFSAETYTSIGFGDVTPFGAIRLLIGAEALNGLLLIGWSASYAFIAMERYWVPRGAQGTLPLDLPPR